MFFVFSPCLPFKSCLGQKNKRKSKANTCSPLTGLPFPLEGQIGLTEFLFLSGLQLQLVPCIVRAGSLFISPSACFCSDIKRVMPQAGRAVLCYLIHCISQDSCFLATSLWRWHSFRWRWLGSDGGTFRLQGIIAKYAQFWISQNS